MNYLEKYNQWLENVDDKEIKDQLLSMENNDDVIKERFFNNISFGTGGLRGTIGAGTDNMNIYTVRKAAQGIADYINNKYKNPSIAISFDCRNKSDVFAKECAKVLAANSIKVFITKELSPTPFLSFITRHYSCNSGIMITASHNPAEYNGLKSYNEHGGQITDNDAEETFSFIEKVNEFTHVKAIDFNEGIDSGAIVYTDENAYNAYLNALCKKSFFVNENKKADNISVVFTPIHGTGLVPVRDILGKIGIKNLTIPKEQEKPDGNFPTAPYPNPEFKEAMDIALNYAKENNADLVIGTDPDADRLGVAVLHEGNYQLLTGNEVGILLFDYIVKNLTTLPKKPVLVRTIVTSPMADYIANEKNIKVTKVLTGFKYIADKILDLEEKGREDSYIFGFEESCGYLYGTYVRDKDAVIAAMLVAEMASYYKDNETSIITVLNSLYDKYGHFHHETGNYTYKGLSGADKINAIMKVLRENSPEKIIDTNVIVKKDYMSEKDTKADDLPLSDVIYLELEDKTTIIVRPSGTEPKIKFYYTTIADTKEAAEVMTKQYMKYVEDILNL